ncbi:MAG TPA: hypothetical protein VFA59_04980 [Vicinamibacterales bacterium]|nr:hypothetical protein [Vicinamibacterales bacterium]
MRKRYRVLMLATFVAAVAGRFGYALSIDQQQQPTPVAMYARTSVNAPTAATVVASPVLVHTPTTTSAADPVMYSVPGAGKLLLLGSFLFGLSAVVRKAI